MRLFYLRVCLTAFALLAGRSASAALPSLSAGSHHTCSLNAGRLACWGFNASGQLGVGDVRDRGSQSRPGLAGLQPAGLGPLVEVAAGGLHTCARDAAGQVACWGDNAQGQLGLGDNLPRTTAAHDTRVDLGGDRRAAAVATSTGRWDGHTCVILTDGEVLCWGDNDEGQLGLGHHRSVGMQQQGPSALAETSTVALPAGRRARQLALGAHHTCALLDDQSLRCWGQNRGQLGLGDGRDRGGSGASMAALKAVDLAGQAVLAVSAGEAHTCALLDDGSINCWGDNRAGQLGLGDRQPRSAPRASGGADARVALAPGHRAVAVACGLQHTCALLDDGSVQCWGDNHGHLGTGDRVAYGAQPDTLGAALPRIALAGPAAALTAGGHHTCAILRDGGVQCWGMNLHGQLGLGDTRPRGLQADDMGDNLPRLRLP